MRGHAGAEFAGAQRSHARPAARAARRAGPPPVRGTPRQRAWQAGAQRRAGGTAAVRDRCRAPSRSGSVARLGSGRTDGGRQRPRRAPVDLPHRHTAVGAAHDRGRRGQPGPDRAGVTLPAVPDRGPALLPGGIRPRGLRQVRAGAAHGARAAGQAARWPARRRAAPAGLHGQVRAPLEHLRDGATGAPARGPGHPRAVARGGRQVPSGPGRSRISAADAVRARPAAHGLRRRQRQPG